MKTIKDNYKKLRKCGANCFATALAVANLETFELIEFFVKMVAGEHKEKEFILEHDGIITFNIKYNNEVIYKGNHYDVEKMLQEGTYVFRDKLKELMSKTI